MNPFLQSARRIAIALPIAVATFAAAFHLTTILTQ